jgi:isocitrate dehydrogenase kinase/phosphatase
VDKLFGKFSHPAEFTPKRFYLYQSLLKNRLGHYTNENSLKLVNELYEPKCENWPEIEQRFYNKICRVLIHHFLHEDSIFIILTSKRMKSDKKADHMRARRQVCQSVLSILGRN